MNCFPCFQSKDKKSDDENMQVNQVPVAQPQPITSPPLPVSNNLKAAPEHEDGGIRTFTFRELATAAKNFRQECLLGEGGFGKVFKGTILPSGETVAIRQLDRNGAQGSKEFVSEILKLGHIQHPNLVKIIGYCADGDQRLLVYEYMPSGSLKKQLFDIAAGQKSLDWSTRMKIALGVAEGLEFLHEKTSPPIIYRDLKSSNILLDATNNPRLSDYGLASLVHCRNSMILSPTVMASYGYCAPEYEKQGELTLKSDVYSFGVVLLELITGRKAMDNTKPEEEQTLVSWAQPIFHDPTRFPDMADPLLRKQFPVTSLNQAVGVAAMCLQPEPSARPLISDISAALSFLAMAPPEAPIPERLLSILSTRLSTSSQCGDNMNSIRESNVTSPRKQDGASVSDGCYSSDSYDDEDEYEEDEEEEENGTGYQSNGNENKMAKSSNASKKLGSSSKRKSKSKVSRRTSTVSRDNSSRCERSNPNSSDSRRESQNHDNDSVSDEEPLNRRPRDKSAKINSRNRSRKDSRKRAMSSKHRQASVASSGFYSSSEEEDITPRANNDRSSNHESEFVYSKSSSIVNKDKSVPVSGSSAAASVQKIRSEVNVDSIQKVQFGADTNSVQKVKSGVNMSSVQNF